MGCNSSFLHLLSNQRHRTELADIHSSNNVLNPFDLASKRAGNFDVRHHVVRHWSGSRNFSNIVDG